MTWAELSVAQVLTSSGDRVGLGFLVADRLVVTCAHVVNAALGRPIRSTDRPDDGTPIRLWFPFAGAATERVERRSRLTDWFLDGDAFDQTDVALLRIGEAVDAVPLRLVEPDGKVEVHMLGPAPNRPHDGHVAGVVMGSTDKTRLQINEHLAGVFRARPGFSGGPVWRPGTVDVVGMLQAIGTGEGAADSYAVSAGVLGNLVRRRVEREGRSRPVESPTGELTVEHDHAELTYDGETYTLQQRRLLHNASSRLVTQYLIRIHVERFPYDPIRNHLYHLDNPLHLPAMNLRAWSVLDDGRREPMRAERLFKHDPGTLEVWLEFKNPRTEHFANEFPVYPGQRRWIEYSYRVPDFQWGPWFQRSVRLKTEVLSVVLNFPLSLDPECRGREISVHGDQALPTPIERQIVGDRIIFSWSTRSTGARPPVNNRYRLDWYFKNDRRQVDASVKLSDLMQEVGIVQRGDPILGPLDRASDSPPILTEEQRAERQARAATSFDLPAESGAARWVLDGLHAAIQRAIDRYAYQRGRNITGIAAPQIGIDRSALIVREPGASSFVELLNPRVLTTARMEQNFEGCLSLFDWRGIVERPSFVEVEHQDLDGSRRITQFGPSMARSVMHEIDHLNKVLFDEVRVPGTRLIPVEEYRSTVSAS